MNAGGGDAVIFGEAGDDDIDGGNGNSVVVGGDDDDKLRGGKGRSILIGGLGADNLKSGKGETILITGFTDYDNDLSKLVDIRTDWMSPDIYTDRVADLLTGMGSTLVKLEPVTTVHDDDVKDKAKGGRGRDWFLVDPQDDRVMRKKFNEILTDIDPPGLHSAQAGRAADTSTLNNVDLDAVVGQAIEEWLKAGISSAQLDYVTVRIADLPDTYLGATFNNVVLIDANAAGFGWQVDPLANPLASSDRMDLLTVVTHEFGHLLGLKHTADEFDVMAQRLSPGVRALPQGDRFYNADHNEDGLFDQQARDQNLNFGLALSSPRRSNAARRQDNVLKWGTSKSTQRHAAAIDRLFQGDADGRLLDGPFDKTVDSSDLDDDLDLNLGEHARLLLDAETGDVDGTL